MKKFLMGNEILAQAAFEAGAEIMYGYPITPTTEVLATWAKLAQKEKKQILQTEDEMAAGFGVCGAALAGVRSFTATGGPGMILMQDPLAMAEAMRLPMVVFDGQRGGPSTGQVIYSQQELNLAIYGGNGEGLRIVYSTSSLQDLYDYGQKAFSVAWRYRFPTIVLYDGYQGKMKGDVEIAQNLKVKTQNSKVEPILTTNMRNTFDMEEELNAMVVKSQQDFDQAKKALEEHEEYGEDQAQTVILAHGIVAAAAKEAIRLLNGNGRSVLLFRPITLSPFPQEALVKRLKKAKKVYLFESSQGQFLRLVKAQIYGEKIPIEAVLKPGLGFTPDDLMEKIK